MPRGPRPPLLLTLLVACCALLAGCAFGNVREREIAGLGPYRDLKVRAVSLGGVPAPEEVNDGVQAGVAKGLEVWNQAVGPSGSYDVLQVDPQLLEVHVANGGAPSPVAEAASQLGLAGAVEAN